MWQALTTRILAHPLGGCIALALLSDPALAQEIAPGDTALRLERLVPFEAEYRQLGHPFLVRMVRSAGADPVWSFQMITEGPTGVQIDHVGHRVRDLAFAYRRFGFAAYRNEYLDASVAGERLTIRRLALDDTTVVPPPFALHLGRAVLDGTFAFWALGALPLGPDRSWRLRTWSPTDSGALARTTPEFRVTGRDTVRVGGRAFPTWIVEAASGPALYRTWVATEPPFLIRQDAVVEGEATTVVQLERLRSPPR